ncbi:MAG: Fis family transcriptional regulator [Desulfobacteraceae bacterium 4572_88]|nr:MAG: Fis family transcriptional regulator [Desulfobacteraceae bacterium 4572_88]
MDILIIDDDTVFCKTLKLVLEEEHKIEYTHTLTRGSEMVRDKAYDVIFLDVQLPDGNGLEALPKLKKTASSPEIIIITGMGDHEGVKQAIENGAWDYIQKGDSFERISFTLLRVLEYRKEKINVSPMNLKRNNIVGKSASIMTCLDLVAQAAASDVNVLITGQTGTGKELFAKTIHENSSRADGNFIAVDCASLTETLVESTLFGHERGSFTGAERTREGLVRLAHDGILFLDEIGELPMSMQKSFLRVLQERKFRPVGGKKEIRSDFRLISATNRDLDGMVQSGHFREDLLYRLRAIAIHLPPLNRRSGDIRVLALHYLDRLCEKTGRSIKNISSAFFEVLEAYHWPGNVRELTHALESAFVASSGGTLIPQYLPAEIRIHAAFSKLDRESRGRAHTVETPFPLPAFKKYRATMTRKYLEELMTGTKGNVREACRISGFSRSRLYELLKKHDIPS